MRLPRFIGLTLVVVVMGGCGGGDDGVQARGAGSTTASISESPSTPASQLPVADYEGNPGDLLTLTNSGEVEHMLLFSSYEQLRDFSDVVAVATLSSIEVERSKTDQALSGTLLAKFTPTEAIGGQNLAQLTDGSIEVTLPLDGDVDTTAIVLERMTPLLDRASYLLFLQRALPGPDGQVRYVLNIDAGLNGALAFWPGDGRLSPIMGQNDLAADAIARGEELTGTSDVPEVLGEPSFDGPAPIGLRADELSAAFARPVGSVETDPPDGWDRYQAALADALDGDG